MEDFGFKYKIGDTVTLRKSVDHYNLLDDEKKADHKFTELLIVERVLPQCPGGIQRHYHDRLGVLSISWNATEYGLGKDVLTFNEIELSEIPQQPKKKKKGE